MYFNFPCSNCSKNLKVREEFRGRKAKCPYCRATVTIPQRTAPEPEAPETEEPAATGGPVTLDGLIVYREPARWPWLLAAAALLAALALFCLWRRRQKKAA